MDLDARPLRIEYEGAGYHVMDGGNGRRVFDGDEDYGLFLDKLARPVADRGGPVRRPLRLGSRLPAVGSGQPRLAPIPKHELRRSSVPQPEPGNQQVHSAPSIALSAWLRTRDVSLTCALLACLAPHLNLEPRPLARV